MAAKNTNTSLVSQNTLNLLMLFSDYQELSVSEMAEHLEINISTTYRIVNTMRALGFIEQKSDKKYVLKPPNILKLYSMVNNEIRDIASPIINSIVAEFEESVYLSELYKEDKLMI